MGKWTDPLYRKQYMHDWYLRNKSKCNRQSREWALAHPSKIIAATRKWRFGLNETEQQLLLSDGCRICSRKATHIDHDHKTGKVRGGLCNNCNTGLGMFQDSIEVLQNAARYLEAA